MSNDYHECKKRLEEYYLSKSKEEVVKILLHELSVDDIIFYGSVKED